MDYDSYIGKFVIPLLDCSNAQAVKSIGNDAKYKIKGILSSAFGSTLSCSIHWVDFPTNSRLEGVWHVVIVNRANNLPLMDAIQFSHTLDADCLVTASNTSSSTGQQFNQQTHASRHGPPIPYETKPSIFQPICSSRESNNLTLKLAFAAHGVSSNDDRDMLEFFKLETITIQNRITWNGGEMLCRAKLCPRTWARRNGKFHLLAGRKKTRINGQKYSWKERLAYWIGIKFIRRTSGKIHWNARESSTFCTGIK